MTVDAIGVGRRRAVAAAIDQWTRRLVDLTGRNRLIFYRPLKSGTLDLDSCLPAAVEALHAGEPVASNTMFDREAGPDVVADAVRRMRTIANTSQANFEEKGIGTLFATSHRATWDHDHPDTPAPNAPVLLAPVRVAPADVARTEFTLELIGPWEFSQTLLMFWAEQAGIQIDQNQAEVLAERCQDDHDRAVAGLAELAGASGAKVNLRFGTGRYIGNFSYTKEPMVRDLRGAVDQLVANDLISAIAGDQAAANEVRQHNSNISVDPRRPDTVPLDQEHLVLDADSSQSYVINAVLAGKSLVVEGPPGTGKSQTIANLIASLAAEGRTALFVAEKRAAIEAVQKRLEQVGLSELALDLHQSSLRKQDTARSLARSLEVLADVATPDTRANQARLRDARSRLVGYTDELHRSRHPWELSSFEVNLRLATISDDITPVPLARQSLLELSPERVVELEGLLDDWLAQRQVIDPHSPWAGVTIASKAAGRQIVELAHEARHQLLPPIDQIARDHHDDGVGPATPTIGSLRLICEVADAVAEIDEWFDPKLWALEPATLAATLGNRPFAGLGADYRQAKRQVAALARTKLKRRQAIESLERAARTQRDWRALPATAVPHRSASIIRLRTLLDTWDERYGPLVAALADRPTDQSLGALGAALDRCLAVEHEVQQRGRLHELRDELRHHGLEPLAEALDHGRIPADQLRATFEASYLTGIRRLIDAEQPELSTFQADRHHQSAEVYARADRSHLETAPQRVLRRVAEHALETRNRLPEQSAIIEREAAKQRKLRSLRQLRGDAGDVLTALRPCWMMSPLMVAQTLPRAAVFDCVIFDEASQVRPEEAISSFIRGRQVIIAGDRRQLPPSAFFTGGDRDLDELADEEDVDALTTGFESILDVASALLPTRMLMWHYRSEDERLISFSNDHIYHRSLETFPGAHRDTPVTFQKVDHRPVSSSEIRSNQTEVDRVVDLMIEAARTRPSESLGVIAFGQAHASNIDDALARRLAEMADPLLEDFFATDRLERAFVKNIERVQGDERDAIILSVGYGKDRTGRVPLRFGPVNQDGGERRLNVAASRARRRMTVVSSISHHDFDPSSLKQGPQLLQALLQFAESGGTRTGADPNLHPLNAFETMVKLELERVGLRPIAQYGSSNFRIDFAIPHPANDGRMVLAVEADGASYHASPTARDRDRLRQQILERLGWRFHRIWSTAFFKDPRGEGQKVLASYHAALAGLDQADASPPPGPPRTPGSPGPRLPPGSPASTTAPTRLQPVDHAVFVDALGGRRQRRRPAPRTYRHSIDDYQPAELVALVRWLTDDGERLITDMELKQLLKSELDYQRMGSRISAAFDGAIRTFRTETRGAG